MLQVVEKHSVKALYLAPAAIRDMMAHGSEPVLRHDRSSLEARPLPHATMPMCLSWCMHSDQSKCVLVDADKRTLRALFIIFNIIFLRRVMSWWATRTFRSTAAFASSTGYFPHELCAIANAGDNTAPGWPLGATLVEGCVS